MQLALESKLDDVASPQRMSTPTIFFRVFAAVTVLKLFLAAITPLTGDEAYFILWGRFPDYGYYDHGAVTGWWLALTLLAGESALILRLPAILAPLLGALLLRRMLQPLSPARADLAATFFLLSPVVLLNILITPESPLLLFSLLATVCGVHAVRRENPASWFVAGIFLGLAFLTKYLAVLLGIAFLSYLIAFGGRRRLLHMLALVVGTAPGVVVNVVWNYHHGWTNVLFNVFTRNVDARLSFVSPLVLAAFMLLVLAGPVVLYYLVRPSLNGRRSWRQVSLDLRQTGMQVALFALAVPLGIFVALSFVRPVGLHWLFSFFPLFFVVLPAKFDAEALRRQLRPILVYAVACSSLVIVLLALPSETFRWHRSYNSIVLGRYPREVLAELAPFSAYTLVTPSYTQSAQLAFHSRRHVPVIGRGSYHGRQDDFLTDFRAFDDRNLMVLSGRAKDLNALQPFFEFVETRVIQVHGSNISLLLGRGFKFAAYREGVLRRVADEYYQMPRWLQRWSRPAPFLARYGLEPAVVDTPRSEAPPP